MASAVASAPPFPARTLEAVVGYQVLHTVATALDIHLFRYVAEGKSTADSLVDATGTAPRGLQRLLNALVGLDLLARDGSGAAAMYSLTPEAAAYLVQSTPGYLGDYVCFAASRLSDAWKGLTAAVRTGVATAPPLDSHGHAGVPWTEFVDVLFPWNYPLATVAASELRQRWPTGSPRLLDVAAGSGAWGIAAAQAHAALRVVAIDLPGVIEHAQRNAEHFGVGERFEYRTGDIWRDPLGEAEFDAAILGHVCHFQGEALNQRLLASVARALKPGGTLIIADILPDEDLRGPSFALLYALSMLVTTEDGDAFTFEQYVSWLVATGFQDARLVDSLGQRLIVATRSSNTF